jgi:hypothetical protein
MAEGESPRERASGSPPEGRPLALIDYATDARSHLKRAWWWLARFKEEEDGRGVVYAALELRMGIEARLFDYLVPATKKLGKKQPSGYAAKKLLRLLSDLDPSSSERTFMVAHREPDGTPLALLFTPVTPELASDHNRLGEILHHDYFQKGRALVLLSKPLGRLQTLVDWAGYLEEVADRLSEACRGNLLGHPSFEDLVAQIDPASSEEPEA